MRVVGFAIWRVYREKSQMLNEHGKPLEVDVMSELDENNRCDKCKCYVGIRINGLCERCSPAGTREYFALIRKHVTIPLEDD